MYKALLFDLDDTILSFSKSEDYAITKFLEYFGIEATENVKADYSKINLSYWQKFERKEIEREKLIIQRFIDFFKIYEPSLNTNKKDYANDVYFEFLSSVTFEMKGAFEVLSNLKDKFDLYCITNGVKMVQDKRLNHSKRIKDLFKMIFISEEINYQKPEKEFMDYIISKTNLKKEDCLIIGDSLTSDIMLGINSGVDTCWLKTKRMMNDNIKPKYVIDKLEDLYDLLK